MPANYGYFPHDYFAESYFPAVWFAPAMEEVEEARPPGGDDVPREERWEKRKKRKKTDESLTLAIESAYKQIMGEEPTAEVIAEIKQAIPEPPVIPKQDYSQAKEWIEQQLRIIESRIEQMREEEEEEILLLM